MHYSILFVIILILVSGFIAYFGDLLGRWMGKKRLTLWHLRPKHTAYGVTAITGMLISAMVLFTLISVNVEFRKVFTEGEYIFAQNKSLKKSNKLLAIQRKELQALVRQQRTEADTARKSAQEAKTERDKQIQLVGKLKKDVQTNKSKLSKLQADLDETRLRSDATRVELDAKIADLNAQEMKLDKVQNQLRSARGNLKGAQKRLDDATSRLVGVNSKLSETSNKLQQTILVLNEQEKALDAQRSLLQDQQSQLVKIGNDALKFETRANEFSRGNLILRQGDEITRGVISNNQSSFGIRADLLSLLKQASDKARQIGAGDDNSERTVTLIRFNADRTNIDISEDNNINLAVDMIAKSPYDALVQIVCARNSIEGEQVPVEPMLYFNKLVYRKGNLIASARMDGRISEGRILLSIIKFLQEDVSKAGLRAGIIPISNPDSRANTSTNPQSQVEGLMTAVDQVKSKNARVTVNAYACRDIYAEGPLNMNNMRFNVEEIK